MNIRNFATMLVLAGLLTAPGLAQVTLDWPVGEFQDYRVDTGNQANLTNKEALVYVDTIAVEGAAWLRLYFGDVVLAPGSYIRMTSALDDEVQELDADDLAMWNNTSAYFNGDIVRIELVAGPRTKNNRVVLDRVALEDVTDTPVGSCGICGPDDRVPSNVNWAGRIMPVGCTGSLWHADGCLVSAGHCVGGDTMIQFNVPDSNSNCSLNNPPVADQFPITGRQYQNSGQGADWSVMTTGTNNLVQTIYERYGELRPISSVIGQTGNPVTVWGYGVDGQCARTQTQQTHGAPIDEVTSTYYRAPVDVTYGNSGSALMLNGAIIGIVTHCPCPHYSTRVDRANFQAARDALCPGPTTETVLPDTLTLIRGMQTEGGIESLFASDDSYLVVQPAALVPLPGPPVQVEVQGVASLDNPSELRFRYEGHATVSPVEQVILMFNYDTQEYDEVDMRIAATSDEVVEIVISDDPGRYIEAGTGRMKTLMTFISTSLVEYLLAIAEFDQAVWTTSP